MKDLKFYRACDTDPPTAEDFTSHAQSALPRKRGRADPANCNHWGLSGWLEKEDAAHAHQLFPFIKRKFIFETELASKEAKVLQTGNPPHHTLWPQESVDLVSRSSLVLNAIAN